MAETLRLIELRIMNIPPEELLDRYLRAVESTSIKTTETLCGFKIAVTTMPLPKKCLGILIAPGEPSNSIFLHEETAPE